MTRCAMVVESYRCINDVPTGREICAQCAELIERERVEVDEETERLNSNLLRRALWIGAIQSAGMDLGSARDLRRDWILEADAQLAKGVRQL